MAAKKYEVSHPSLYLRVNGKLQHVPQGTHVDLEAKAAEGLIAKGKLSEIKGKISVPAGDK